MTILIYIFIAVLAVAVGFAVYAAIRATGAGRRGRPALLTRSPKNPILAPNSNEPWENAAVFNPAAVYANGRVHLFYRALGTDGISRIGYAVSADGVHFERSSRPAFTMRTPSPARFKNPFSSSANFRYDTDLYASGGGWGGDRKSTR